MIHEVSKKAMMATTSSGSLTRKEKAGGARCAKPRAATMEATVDATKLPVRDTSTITITKREASRSEIQVQSVASNGK